MALTPLDIHNKEFHRSFRGYSEEEVDEFLDEIVREWESLLKENAALKEQLEAANARTSQYEKIEESLHNALIVAQGTADEVRANARKEAETIIRQAEQEAERLKQEKLKELHEYERRIEELKREDVAFRARLRSLLESQIALLAQDGFTRSVSAQSESTQDSAKLEPSRMEPMEVPFSVESS